MAKNRDGAVESLYSDPPRKWKRDAKAGALKASRGRSLTPKGFIPTDYAVPRSAYAWIQEHIQGRHGLTWDDALLVLHVLRSETHRRSGTSWGVPVSSRLRAEALPNASHERVVEAGLLDFMPHDSRRGRSREYRASEDLQQAYARALASALPHEPKVHIVTGKATTKLVKTTTRDSRTGARHDPAMIAAMKAIRYGVFDHARVAEHVGRSEQEARAAAERALRLTSTSSLREARLWASNAKGAPDIRSDDDPVQAVDEALRLHGRFVVDAAVLASLCAQAVPQDAFWTGTCPDDAWCSEQGWAHGRLPDGVLPYRHAYTAQSTGRMSDVGGRFQNGTRELKHAAVGAIPGVRNYDIASSQPRFLLSQLDLGGVPTSNLERILGADKREHADACGLRVDAWKAAFMALVMGARLFPSWERACAARPDGSVAAIISDGSEAYPERSYDAFSRYVRPLYADLDAWRTWLVTDWLPDRVTRGDGGGAYVANDAGARLCVSEIAPDRGAWTGNALLKRKLAAHVLQGMEAAFIRAVTSLQHAYGYRVVANEHDGVVVIGEVPEAAVEEARRRTGYADVELVEKPLL